MVWLYLNGQLLARSERNHADVQPERLLASGRLVKGENRVVLKILSGWDGRANLVLRHEPADAVARIALLKQLAADFPTDTEMVTGSLQDISKLWESQGFALKAMEPLGEIIDHPEATAEQVDAAWLDRIRLHRDHADRQRACGHVVNAAGAVALGELGPAPQLGQPSARSPYGLTGSTMQSPRVPRGDRRGYRGGSRRKLMSGTIATAAG